MEFLAAVGAIVELTVYCIGMQSFVYTVWGLAHPMWLFYPVDTFRVFRVLVVIRFLVMQKVWDRAYIPQVIYCKNNEL